MPNLQISFQPKTVARKFPLRISRGVAGPVHTLFTLVTDGTHTGIGEGMPCYGSMEDIATTCPDQLTQLFQDCQNKSLYQLNQEGKRRQIPSSALASLDIALWDLKAKQANLPLYQLLGLPLPSVPTSITIGIESKEVIQERVPYFINLINAKKLKIKLGSPEGQVHDQEIFLNAQAAAAPYNVSLRIDANGGWDVPRAQSTIKWLAEQGCDYVEQPLPKGQEADLAHITPNSPLPIFLDESIATSQDVANYAHLCHGINLKLMKSGGITEGHAVLLTARAHNLQTMIGCMSDTSIAIAAGAALSGLCDHIDLDNHFNLDPDPAGGLSVLSGIVLPPNTPGHGASLNP